MSHNPDLKDNKKTVMHTNSIDELSQTHLPGHINATDQDNPAVSTMTSQKSFESSLKKILQNPFSASDQSQNTKNSRQARPADVTSALILWFIALLGNFIGLLSTIIDGSLQTELHQAVPMQIPPELTRLEIRKIYTTSGYIALAILTIITALLIWKYSQGTKVCYILLTAGGFFTILQMVGVFFAQESPWKAIAAIIAGIATFGAVLCGRTNDSMQYFGFKQGNNGKN